MVTVTYTAAEHMAYMLSENQVRDDDDGSHLTVN